MRRKPLTDDEQARIGELRRRNWTQEAIAREIGCTIGSVNWCCLKHGFQPKKPMHRLPVRFRSNGSYVRRGRIVRAFTPAEDALVLKFEAEGLSYAEIGRRLNRKPNSIQGRLLTLMRYEDREVAA